MVFLLFYIHLFDDKSFGISFGFLKIKNNCIGSLFSFWFELSPYDYPGKKVKFHFDILYFSYFKRLLNKIRSK